MVEQVRQNEGRNAQPSAAIIDRQSAKTTESGGERGFCGGKNINERKRHVISDTCGNLLDTLVSSGDIHDGEGGEWLLAEMVAKFPNIHKIWADSAYEGHFVEYAREQHGIEVEIVRRSEEQRGFVLLPIRWIIERTIAWLSRHRRLSKDYEHLPETSVAVVRIAAIDLMLKRLKPDTTKDKPYKNKDKYKKINSTTVQTVTA